MELPDVRLVKADRLAELQRAEEDLAMLARAVQLHNPDSFGDWLLMQDISSRLAEAPGTMGRRDIEGMSDVRLALLWASDQIEKED